MNASNVVLGAVCVVFAAVMGYVTFGPANRTDIRLEPPVDVTPTLKAARDDSCQYCPHDPHDPGQCVHVTTDGPVRTSCGCDAGVGLQEEGTK